MNAQFHAAAEAAGATVKHFSSRADVVPYLRHLAGERPVSASRLPEEVSRLCRDLNLSGGKDLAHASICVSYAEAGIAATGSVVLDLADPVGRSATALAPIHAVILEESTIAPDLGSLHDRLRHLLAERPQAYISITTGPSRTADIERVLTIGVHGPKELHILVVGENE